jgi:hypothetical protein
MIALVHCAPSSLEEYRQRYYGTHLGILSSPRRFYTDIEGWQWAADNDAFSAWDEGRYRHMLNSIADLPGGIFVTAPDVVGDADATTDLFHTWLPELRQVGKPIAYVTQDGLEMPPWGEFDAMFLGGSSEWKMGERNRALVYEAKRRGLWVHMGRVNGAERVRYAKAIGCDSFDGTSLSWFKEDKLVRLLKATRLPTQMMIET